ncbi:uncharacterized protein LOC144101576 [Amblyomma americanum]
MITSRLRSWPRKTISERSRLQQLLITEDHGDSRPSQLLHRMRQLLRDHPPDANSPLFRALFLQRLPQDLVVVQSAAVSSAASSTRVNWQSSLEVKIDHLTSTVATLRASIPRRYHRSSRQRLRHRSSSSHRSSPARDGFCWYHRKFGAAARQCRQPCQWSGNAPASH